MGDADTVPAFDAFEKQLTTLCLNEFPCGIGSWREHHNEKREIIEREKVNSIFPVTLQDYGANHEKTETLEELLREKHSPWKQDYSWSDEAKQLREIAVRSPWLIDERFVLGHFKTLRIVDKNVSEVDESLLKFRNLEELSLSANFLRTVNSNNLPPNLRLLELCANQISNLADLCMKPPPLEHLGLGYNRLTMVDDYITGEYWPHLLSLDLGHNNLCDLMDIIRKLQTLPMLRNLILHGNPLSLIPGCRGYTIDSIKKLTILDDIPISADERHLYRGLAKHRECILDEAKLGLHVSYIKGVPMPEELKDPESQSEYPIITRKYSVHFLFLEDRAAPPEIFQLMYEGSVSATPTQLTETQMTARESNLMGSQNLLTDDSYKDEEKNVNFTQDVQPGAEDRPVAGSRIPEDPISPLPQSQLNESDAEFPQPDGGAQNEEVAPSIRVAPIKSEASLWAENMEIQWTRNVTRDDLLALRNFLKEGMEIQVVEEKVLSYPADQIQDGVLSPAPSSKGGKKDKKDKKEDKGKDTKDKGKTDKVEDTKKKKKKGEPDIELYHMAPELTTLATFHVPLVDFLDGEYRFEAVFQKNMEDLDRGQTPTSERGKKDGKKDKKKPGSGKKKEGKDKDGRRSAKGEKGKEKDAKGEKVLTQK